MFLNDTLFTVINTLSYKNKQLFFPQSLTDTWLKLLA